MVLQFRGAALYLMDAKGEIEYTDALAQELYAQRMSLSP
jgi:hypothetical protein